MGIEFLQNTVAQHNQVRQIIDALRSKKQQSAIMQVHPEGLEATALENAAMAERTDDALVDLFRSKSQIPVETFLQQMQQR